METIISQNAFNGSVTTGKGTMVDNRREQREQTTLEKLSALPTNRTKADSTIKGEETHNPDGSLTFYGLLVLYRDSRPIATTEQANYKRVTLSHWADREASKMEADDEYTPTMDRDGEAYIFNEENPPASIADVDTELARSQAYNRRNRKARQDMKATRASEIAQNGLAMREACLDSAIRVFGQDSEYAKAAKYITV